MLAFLVMKHSIYVSEKCCEEKHVDLLLIGKEGKKDTVFLSKILILSCMIILSIVEESISLFVVYKLLLQKTFYKALVKTTLKLMANKRL